MLLPAPFARRLWHVAIDACPLWSRASTSMCWPPDGPRIISGFAQRNFFLLSFAHLGRAAKQRLGYAGRPWPAHEMPLCIRSTSLSYDG